MSYTKSCILDYELRYVLFLLLARLSIRRIGDEMDCCPRKITACVTRLMQMFCGDVSTDSVVLYSTAKKCTLLCRELAEEFRQRYPDLAKIVERHTSVELEKKEKDGETVWYIHRR
ncbi:MAG TPA: hypothetical protein VI757_05135 [Bacteroidia bacterium]|nr:hypothetical protein [Bacteroidia bacterium]